MKPYHPSPLDTDQIELPEELVLLTEKLAENAHDNWAKLRIEEGWKWGKQRDDNEKTHPGLVPYNQLSDSEKEYDRRTSLETLKVVMALGYTIKKAKGLGNNRLSNIA